MRSRKQMNNGDTKQARKEPGRFSFLQRVKLPNKAVPNDCSRFVRIRRESAYVTLNVVHEPDSDRQ